MRNKTLIWAVTILSLIGLLDALYLYISHVIGIPVVCGVSHGCATVAASPYSKFLGIQLALYGVIYYAGMFILSAALFSYDRAIVRMLLFIGGIVGALMSISFIYIQGALIGAFCIYCLGSAVVTFLLAPTGYLLWSRRGRPLPMIEPDEPDMTPAGEENE